MTTPSRIVTPERRADDVGDTALRPQLLSEFGLTVTGTLPDPGTIPAGKLFTVKILDVGGSIKLVCANVTVTIDGGLNYFLNNQYAFVRLLANGSTYNVVGAG